MAATSETEEAGSDYDVTSCDSDDKERKLGLAMVTPVVAVATEREEA